MDGFKRRLNASLQLKLSFSLSLAILVVAVVAGIVSFVSALHEAHELQDDTLRQIATLIDRQGVPFLQSRAGATVASDNKDSRIVVEYLAAGGQQGANIAGAEARLPIPADLPDGAHTLRIKGESFRVLIKTAAGGGRIAVTQETDVRDEIARDAALQTSMPFLILVPILVFLIADLVRKMFRPIAALSLEIDRRAERELHPIETSDLPVEVRPFVVAINRLLTRVAQSMEAQHRFVADAAHELRSPLTALSLQAERLAEAEMSATARERLSSLRQGIERGRNLLDQLLTLARAQSPSEPLPATEPVSVQSVYRRVLEDIMPLAEAKEIDVGVEGTEDAMVGASELDLIAIVKNLVDNAIRYTPRGGKVDLSVRRTSTHVVLRVIDNGPGIAPDERARVFDPFYRTLGSNEVGSGLGLSIVKAIAERLGAEVRLEFADEAGQSGLCVSVLIPTQ
ncbi:two-component sensor histidine kinase [Paraburkholderia sp. NMBU_R16]|uniref:ATP-binding protein n=1 Tax=Paraburkholderia sp. NMBU_R16 TaxID=2698676 RepID=UPI0015653A60|nr:ATP-binding protein [Paraburkholderia sp. NMBU_R16]NRO98168.1 two-component sensor histidine kinase [Paraburkholderia sp. NMBU_R16]